MVKIGPAFHDYVSREKTNRPRGGGLVLTDEIISLVPIFLLILVLFIISARLFYVQVLRSNYYVRLSDENRTRTEIIPAPRGIIYDRVGRPLVANTPSYKIVEKVENEEKVTRLSNEQALKLISQGKKVESDIRREYLYKDAFPHVLGYVGQITKEELASSDFSEYGITDYSGKMGLEQEYEKILHGRNGRKLFEVDASGKFVRELGQEEPVGGQSIKTTLDLDVQLAAHKAFKDIEKGAAVVSDPRNGAILAIYSKPTYDPNIFTYDSSYKPEGEYKSRESILLDSEKQPLLDRAISGVYPPGSTFKLVSAVAALEKKAVDKDTLIEDTGILRVGEFSFGNWYFLQHGRKDGEVNVIKAIARSNDIYFYKASEKTGVETISSFARQFGLGSRLGIDLPGESVGTVPSPLWKEEVIGEPWYLGDTFNYGIGQGYLLTTPLQVNSFTNVFANHGTLFRPHIVESQEKILKKNFLKRENVDLVREGMRQSCEAGGVAWPFFEFKVKNDRIKIDNKNYIEDASGSAKMVRVKVGCKTGTAEVGDAETKPHAWITVFAPYYNPEVVVTVLVENSGEGSSVAGPVARDILKDYFEKK